MSRTASLDREIAHVSRILRKTYSDWDHFNLRNPLNELLFILCSTRTGEGVYRGAYTNLRMRFPTFAALARASEIDLAAALSGGGLQNKKARAIRGIFNTIIESFGSLTLSPLRRWSDDRCETFLTSLPGVGRKIARCVMMYSLGRKVFPVDTHCWRISKRLGWVRPTQGDGHCADRDMNRLQEKIPASLRFSLHVNMISLGRDVCVAGRPRCEVCPIERFCRKVGVKT